MAAKICKNQNFTLLRGIFLYYPQVKKSLEIALSLTVSAILANYSEAVLKIVNKES